MENYYIGLDIGTDSIGWAVTNEAYRILKCKGNAMWGIRLLEGGQTAEDRRGFRSGRRRTERNKFRLSCLQMLFSEVIAQKDVAFFQRLKESNLYVEDKSSISKYALFSDADYTDKDFHKAFPTVYHLRKELIANPAPHDVRLVYLALAHILKHRGHFLFDSDFESEQSGLDFKAAWEAFSAYCKDNYSIDLFFEDTEKIAEILKDSKATKTKKKQLLSELLSVSKKSETVKYAILTLLTGGTASAAVLFEDEAFKDSECKNVCISSGYDENAPLYESIFGEKAELLEEIKAIYDWAVLSNILKGEQYLSFAKVETYEKHNQDLQLLKAYVKAYCPEKKALIFDENKKGTSNYLAYSGHSKKGSPEETGCTQEKFCEFLKKQLPKTCGAPKYEDMYLQIETGTFLPKAVSKDNSVIPMQIQKAELCAILKNAESYLPFLKDVDKSGKSVSQKIIDIFSFRIPYYVGPLNTHSDKSWICRTNEKIYPWNFESVVDTDKSAEQFIRNLTSKCTYLPKEDVIPKDSLLYSSFMVLNELNNVRINSEKLPVALKQEIYNELFLKRNKVTQKGLLKFLESKGYKDILISGLDGDFKANLKSYRDLEGLPLTESEKEEIIKAITIFGEDKKLLKKRLQVSFGHVLSPEQIKNVCRLKYSGWSRLSKQFLVGIEGALKGTGEVCNIMHALWDSQNNLMQILSAENTFFEAVEKENGAMPFTSLKEEVEALYVSPKVKRPIYQSMQIVEELVKLRGAAPAKIFVEVARGPEEIKMRTTSRKQRLEELYKTVKKQEPELYKLLQSFSENDLRRDALYLYFTQFGRCMYSGKALDLEEINNRNICDIDHIFPQSKIKDDSLTNRVLVLKTENEAKGNIYPIKAEIRAKMQNFWKMLLDKGWIENSKYERLIRTTPLSDEELSQFISRQLVETRQSTKAIAELLKRRYESSEIVYVKAGLVSDFRHEFKFVKSRDVNDLHHAKDAYLNIVVGNVYNTQFNHNKAIYIKGLQDGTCSVKTECMFGHSVKGAWIAEHDTSMSTVRAMMRKNNIRFTRYAYCQKGGLFDQNILKKGNGQVSIKANSPRADIEKYGGYNRPTSTYFCIASYADKKDQTIKIIVPVDLYREKAYLESPKNYVSAYLRRNVYSEVNPDTIQVLIPKIKYNALISVNGFRMHISSKSSGGAIFVCKPAMQLVLSPAQEQYTKHISTYLQKCADKKRNPELTPLDKLSKAENEALYTAIYHKLTETIFKEKFARLGAILKDKQERFTVLTVYEQFTVLMQILAILHADVRTGDLTLLGEAKKSGVTSIGNKIVKSNTLKSFKLIHQSITGLYETETELLD